MTAIFHGDISDHQKSVRTKLSEYFQPFDKSDEEFFDEGRALLMEATALGAPHTDEELAIAGMKNLATLSVESSEARVFDAIK